MRGDKLIKALKRKFRVSTDAALMKHLGISIQAVQVWKTRNSVTPRQAASLVHKASFQSTVLRPIVEFFPISKCETRRAAAYEVFSARVGVTDHPYRAGLIKELGKHHGVYIFFDSRGQAIYAGKARRQSLWKEINLAFNRDRGEVQTIRRVGHPARRLAYTVKPRQIVSHVVPLYELASYFSAYHAPDPMIGDLEALLVRSFANDLLNIKMEKFSR